MVEWVEIGRAKPVRIYALCDMADMRPRYVGKTFRSLRKRLIEHKRQPRRTPVRPVCRWVSKMEREGRDIVIKLLELVPEGGDWSSREVAWIERLGRSNRLLNATSGGESGILTEEARLRMAQSLRTGGHFDCEECGANFYRKRCEIEKGNSRFCSRACYQEWQAGKSKPVSEQCTQMGVRAAAKKRRAQTHCLRGHPLSGKNLFMTSQGSRGCKECRKIHKRNYRGKAK